MSLGKRISKAYRHILCFVFGHTPTNVCLRCGRAVWLKDKPKTTLADRINNAVANRRAKRKPKYEGSIACRKGMTLYSVNVITGEIKPVEYTTEGKEKKATHNPLLLYISAINQENAERKAKEVIAAIRQ